MANTSKHGNDRRLIDKNGNEITISMRFERTNIERSRKVEQTQDPLEELQSGWSPIIEVNAQDCHDAIDICHGTLLFWEGIFNQTVRAHNKITEREAKKLIQK